MLGSHLVRHMAVETTQVVRFTCSRFNARRLAGTGGLQARSDDYGGTGEGLPDPLNEAQ